MKKKIILILLTFITSTAHGMVYSWTDTAGIAHYTNKEYEIPARYRAKVKARYPELSDVSAPRPDFLTPQLKPVVPKISATPNVVTNKKQKIIPEHAGKWKKVKLRAERSTYIDE
jgi:hypothetical protein